MPGARSIPALLNTYCTKPEHYKDFFLARRSRQRRRECVRRSANAPLAVIPVAPTRAVGLQFVALILTD
jgi:hypothetical protein